MVEEKLAAEHGLRSDKHAKGDEALFSGEKIGSLRREKRAPQRRDILWKIS